jgi:ribosomal-protein-alanine N-acetyltransferase
MGLFLNGEDTLIGFSGFWFFHDPPPLQLLYGVAPAHWNKGLATEVAIAMSRSGFAEHSFDRIEASTDGTNRASIRVMEKAGMKFEKRVCLKGIDTIYYSISRHQPFSFLISSVRTGTASNRSPTIP